LIGINSQILSPSGGNIGIGFAIPSNMARAVMDQLLKTGKVRRGMMGVTIQSVDADLAASVNLPAARGAIVTSVQAGTPAEKVGIKRGDIITAFNNQPVADSNSLRNLVASTAPGAEVTLTLFRDNKEQNVKLALAELPERARQEGDDETAGEGTGSGKFGLTLQPLTPDVASRLGLTANEKGLVVTKIDPAGSAADSGIRQGDLIQEVNRRPVNTLADFGAAVQLSGARPALVLLKRGADEIYVTLKPGS
jgi:S1-C subfamily serine protease